MSEMPPRTLLLAAPAAAAIAAVAAETGIALANVADPYVTLCADYHRFRSMVDDREATGDETDAAYALWRSNDEKLVVTRATSKAGALAGLHIALEEFTDSYGDRDGCLGDRLMFALLESAIAVLEREVAHV